MVLAAFDLSPRHRFELLQPLQHLGKVVPRERAPAPRPADVDDAEGPEGCAALHVGRFAACELLARVAKRGPGRLAVAPVESRMRVLVLCHPRGQRLL